MEEIATVFAEHQAWMSRQYAADTFLLSGAQVPRTGAVILARGTDRAAIEELVAQDPVALADLADYRVVEFTPTTTARDLAHLTGI
jgi:uncharacterized protein YciI